MAKAVKLAVNVNVNGKNVIAQASTSSKELAVHLGLAEEKSKSLQECLITLCMRGGREIGKQKLRVLFCIASDLHYLCKKDILAAISAKTPRHTKNNPIYKQKQIKKST